MTVVSLLPFYHNWVDKSQLVCFAKILEQKCLMLLCLKILNPGSLRASSRGKTGGVSVIRDDWA